MKFLPKIDGLSLRLGIGVALLVVCGLAVGFFLVYRQYQDLLLEETRKGALQEATLIRQALEYQMLEKDRRLIHRMVSGFASGGEVKRVMVLDRLGLVRHSSDPSIRSSHFDAMSPTCQGCHRLPPDKRGRSTVLALKEGKVLRVVQPIPNRKACHRCHDAALRINGLIIVDLPIDRALRNLESTVFNLALWAALIGVALVVGIAMVLRRLVLRRLFRFEATARAIAGGDLGRRLEVNGDDALTRVESQFNRMADSITELLAEIRQQHASLEKVMNSVDDGMLVLDQARRVIATNSAFLRRVGKGVDQVKGAHCCGSPSRGEHQCMLTRDPKQCPTLACFDTGEPQIVVVNHTQPDGKQCQEEVITSPVKGADGQITHVVEVWRDITERRSAEARMADYQRMISMGMLAAGISHEVNTPLASVGTCLEAIKRICATEDELAQQAAREVAEYAGIASSQVQRCGTITAQFLDLARGKSPERDIVDLVACAELVVQLCSHRAREAEVSLELEPCQEIPSVLAGGSSVQQVLLNLVLNAIEASEPGQRVWVSFETKDMVAAVVRDEGRGISPEDRTQVFEPFFTTRSQGTGLGLFVSLNLARGWDGDIQLDSEPGRGTTFRIIFPRHQPEGTDE